LNAAKQLQREVRGALTAILARNPRPLISQFNRAGALRYVVWWGDSPHSKRRKSQPKRWNLARLPRGTGLQYLRQVITIWIVDTLPFAERLGRCARCEQFFLSQRTRPQRFCSERCSTEWHNKRRLASGYFTERRRIQRARTKREAQPSS
jgi:hypothetical protein